MRYHAELGVGHMYAPGQAATEGPEGVDEQLDGQDIISESGEGEHEAGGPLQSDSDEDESSEAGVDGTDDEDSNADDMNDEERLALDDMYG